MSRLRPLIAVILVLAIVMSSVAYAVPTYMATESSAPSNVTETTENTVSSTYAPDKEANWGWYYFVGVDLSKLAKLLELYGFDEATINFVKAVNAGKLPIKAVRLRVPETIALKAQKLDGIYYVSPIIEPTVAGYEKLPGTIDEPETFFTIILQGSQYVWDELGYTGEGVKVAVVDSGVDFANPGLYGTWAVDPNTGWPIAFDPTSLELYQEYGAYGFGVGVPVGSRYAYSHYADTSDEVTAENGMITWYNPYLGEEITYELADESLDPNGVYHIGLHPDNSYMAVGITDQPFTVLVVDEETVYVDLNLNYKFEPEEKITKDKPIAYLDLDEDGLPDVASGLVYFIADGESPIPFSDVLFGDMARIPDALSLVAFMYAPATEYGNDHGTLCAAAVAGNPEAGPASGMAPGAKIIAVGNFYVGNVYWSLIYTVYGNDGVPQSGDDPQVVSMSFGSSWYPNPGWDYYSRFYDYIARILNPTTTYVAAAANDGIGHGTVTPPGAAPAVVTAGAATEFWYYDTYNRINDYIAYQIGYYGYYVILPPYAQIIYFSSRGPTALGQVKPDVTSVGAWATGYVPVWEGLYGIWGGTSLATPLTAGITALVYEAYKATHGEWPTSSLVKDILKSAAMDQGYPGVLQGAGFLDAYTAVLIATETDGTLIRPTTLQIGETDYPAFLNYLKPGESVTKEITLTAYGGNKTYQLSVGYYTLISEKTYPIKINLAGEEVNDQSISWEIAPYMFKVPLDPDAKFVVARVDVPAEIYDPENDGFVNNRYSLAAYYWLDLDGDGIAFVDIDGDGVITGPIDVNGDGIISDDEPHGEVDFTWFDVNGDGQMQVDEITFEIMRANYAIYWAESVATTIGLPTEWISSYAATVGAENYGLIIGVFHGYWNGSYSIDGQTITLTVEQYGIGMPENVPQVTVTPSVTVASGESATVDITVTVPEDAAPGFYEPMLFIDVYDEEENLVEAHVIPIAINVVPATADYIEITPTDETTYYKNTEMYVAAETNYRAYRNSGDWRIFHFEVPDADENDYVLAMVEWTDEMTDIDAWLFGPSYAYYMFPTSSVSELQEYYGPYGLEPIAGSYVTYDKYYVYTPYTYTGEATKEIIVGKATMPGLYGLRLHLTNAPGTGYVSYNAVATLVKIEPDELSMSGYYRDTVTATITVEASKPVDVPVTFEVYGPGVPNVIEDKLEATGDYKLYGPFTVEDAKMLDVKLDDVSDLDDLDLYVYKLVDGSLVLVGVGATSSGDEHVRLYDPEDGLYYVMVDGYEVVDGEFVLTVLPIPAETSATLDVSATSLSEPITITLTYTIDVPGTETLAKTGLIGYIIADVDGYENAIEIPFNVKVKLRPIIDADTGIEPTQYVAKMPIRVKILDPETMEPLSGVLVAFQPEGMWPMFYITDENGVAGPYKPARAGNLTIYAWIGKEVYTTVVPVVYDEDAPVIDSYSINGMSTDIYVNTNEIEVAATMHDPSTFVYKAVLKIDGTTVYTAEDLVNGITSIDTSIDVSALEDGVHELTIEVYDYYVYLSSYGQLPEEYMETFDVNAHKTSITIQFVLDRTAPVITLVEPKDGCYYASSEITVKGSVEESYLLAVYVNGVEVPVDPETLTFETTVTLEEGANTITVEAVDLAGNTAETTLTVYKVSEIGVYYEGEPLTTMTSGETIEATVIVTIEGEELELATVTVTAPTLITGFEGKVVIFKYEGTTYLAVKDGVAASVNGVELEVATPEIAVEGYTYFVYPKDFEITDEIYVEFSDGNSATYSAVTNNAGVSEFPVKLKISDGSFEPFTVDVTVTGLELYQVPYVKTVTIGGAVYPIFTTMYGIDLYFYLDGELVQADLVPEEQLWLGDYEVYMPHVSTETVVPIVATYGDSVSTFLVTVKPGVLSIDIENPNRAWLESPYFAKAGETFTITVYLDGEPVEGARIMLLSLKGTLLLVGVTDENGVATITIPEDYTQPDILRLTVGYNFDVGSWYFAYYDVPLQYFSYIILNSLDQLEIKAYLPDGTEIQPGDTITLPVDYIEIKVYLAGVQLYESWRGPKITMIIISTGEIYFAEYVGNGVWRIDGDAFKNVEDTSVVKITAGYSYDFPGPPFYDLALSGSFFFKVSSTTSAAVEPSTTEETTLQEPTTTTESSDVAPEPQKTKDIEYPPLNQEKVEPEPVLPGFEAIAGVLGMLGAIVLYMRRL